MGGGTGGISGGGGGGNNEDELDPEVLELDPEVLELDPEVLELDTEVLELDPEVLESDIWQRWHKSSPKNGPKVTWWFLLSYKKKSRQKGIESGAFFCLTQAKKSEEKLDPSEPLLEVLEEGKEQSWQEPFHGPPTILCLDPLNSESFMQ